MTALPRDWAALGARLDRWAPPRGPFEPGGGWSVDYVRHSLIPSPDGSPGGGVAGTLAVRRIGGDRMVRLEIAESVVTGFATLTTKAGIDGGPAPLLTPRRWSVDIRWDTRAPGRAEAGEMDQQREGRAEEREIVLRGTRERRIPAPERWTSSWSLFAVVPALPFEAGAALEFDLLEDLELPKPGQRIVYVGRHEVPLAGRAMNLHVFEQTGRGVLPWRWWLDDAHRILLAAGGRRAYLLGAPARKGAAA